MDLVELVANMKVWKRRDQRAPHKPLLLLLLIGLYDAGHPRMVAYAEIEQPLRDLLRRFGPKRHHYKPEEPFVRLQGDGFWELSDGRTATDFIERQRISPKDVREENPSGGLSAEARSDLEKPEVRAAVLGALLDEFPESRHFTVMQAAGLRSFEYVLRRKRDPQFRQSVLDAYDSRCAVCGFQSFRANCLVGIEAAHIKWHKYDGPNTVGNAIALCSLHHSLFDAGVIAVDANLRLQIASDAHGKGTYTQMVEDFANRTIHVPRAASFRPLDSHVEWHLREVFQA